MASSNLSSNDLLQASKPFKKRSLTSSFSFDEVSPKFGKVLLPQPPNPIPDLASLQNVNANVNQKCLPIVPSNVPTSNAQSIGDDFRLNENPENSVTLNNKFDFMEDEVFEKHSVDEVPDGISMRIDSESISSMLAILDEDAISADVDKTDSSASPLITNTNPKSNRKSIDKSLASNTGNSSVIIDLTAMDSKPDVIDLTVSDDADVRVHHVTKRLSYTVQVANLIINHLHSINGLRGLPKSIAINQIASGIEIDGSSEDVYAAERLFNQLTWIEDHRRYECPKLSSYLDSDSWKDFVKMLETLNVCAISVNVESSCDQSTVQRRHASDSQSLRRVSSDFTNRVNESQSCHPHFQMPPVPSGFSLPPFCNGFPVLATSPRLPQDSVNYGNLKVTVCVGDITDDDSAAIVNGAHPSFDMEKGGMVSRTLLHKGGPGLALDLVFARDTKFASNIRVTTGHNLHCNMIIHVVAPKNLNEYCDRIVEVLETANQLMIESIAIPTIGTGGNNLDPFEVSMCMGRAIKWFAHNTQPTSLKTVKVVIFDASYLSVFRSNVITCQELHDFGNEQVKVLEENVSSLWNSNKSVIRVKSDRMDTVNKVLEKIERHMEGLIMRRKIDIERLSRFDDHDIIDLYETSLARQVQIIYSKDMIGRVTDFTLLGLKDDVISVHERLRELDLELREASTLSKRCVWKWDTGQRNFVVLPCRVSQALETLYEMNSLGQGEVRHLGKSMRVNFITMTYCFDKFEGKIERAYSLDLPSHWDDMNGKSMVRIPLVPNSPEFLSVMTQLRFSNPDIRCVHKIERVQNPVLYQQFIVMRDTVAKRLMSNRPVERQLFHGTSEKDANQICAYGFDRSFAGKNATAYGRGTYFAVTSSYSVSFSKKNLGAKQFCMFLARVITGDYTQGRSDMRAPPEKPQPGSDPVLFNSVVDNVLNPTMFVVFKDSSVYPSYLISFS